VPILRAHFLSKCIALLACSRYSVTVFFTGEHELYELLKLMIDVSWSLFHKPIIELDTHCVNEKSGLIMTYKSEGT
jgi:hypothetical protein